MWDEPLNSEAPVFELDTDTISRQAMTGFLHVAVAVLSLLSAGQSAPVTGCESLIQPLEIQGRGQLLDIWMNVAESTEKRESENILNILNFRESNWVKITAGNETDALALIVTTRGYGLCFTVTVKMTLENNTLQPAVPNVTLKDDIKPEYDVIPSTINLLKTGCSDCLVLRTVNEVFGRQGLVLLSKRRTVTAAELEEFKKQAECLNLSQPFSLNPEGVVCPEPPSQETVITDEPMFLLNGQKSDVTNVTKAIINSVGGQEHFMKLVHDPVSKED